MFSRIAVMGLAGRSPRRPSVSPRRPFRPTRASSSIIVNDPSNPYWKTEGDVAAAEAKKLGYTANVSAHKGDTNTREPPGRHGHHQPLQGDHPRPGRTPTGRSAR